MKKELKEQLLNKHKKYESLVSFARKTPEMIEEHADVKQMVDFLYENYKEELYDLADPETSEWSHGFNSGCYAMLNYIFDAENLNIKFAEENWPNLDT